MARTTRGRSLPPRSIGAPTGSMTVSCPGGLGCLTSNTRWLTECSRSMRRISLIGCFRRNMHAKEWIGDRGCGLGDCDRFDERRSSQADYRSVYCGSRCERRYLVEREQKGDGRRHLEQLRM